MDFPKYSYPHSELTEKIIGAAYRVGSEVKPGLVEKIYENALCIDFGEQQLNYSQQKQFPVFYHKKICGNYIPDLIVEDTVIVDTKVVEHINDEHIAKMLNYLSIAELEVGLIINYKHQSVQIRRVANTHPCHNYEQHQDNEIDLK